MTLTWLGLTTLSFFKFQFFIEQVSFAGLPVILTGYILVSNNNYDQNVQPAKLSGHARTCPENKNSVRASHLFNVEYLCYTFSFSTGPKPRRGLPYPHMPRRGMSTWAPMPRRGMSTWEECPGGACPLGKNRWSLKIEIFEILLICIKFKFYNFELFYLHYRRFARNFSLAWLNIKNISLAWYLSISLAW